MNSSYLFGEDKEWGRRYYFTYYSEFGDRRGASGIEVLVLAISFVVAVIANLGIGACVLRFREMRTPINLCLVNLAAADLLFALGVPAVAYTRLTQTWMLGETVCRMLPYSQFVCGFVLLWTLTLISKDRHRCLAVAPYRSTLTVGRVLAASLLTWLIAATVFLPAAFWFQPKVVENGSTICTLVFPRSDILNVSLWFTMPIILIACLLPMALLIYYYQRIFKKILDTRNRWAVSCVAQGLDGDGSKRRDSELSVVGTLVPWAGRKLSSASIQGIGGGNSSNTNYTGTSGGANSNNQACGRQTRAGSLSQHEELRLHKHLRVVRILLLNMVVVLAMWIPITVIMVLIYVDGRRPTEDTGFFLRSHHFIWVLIIAQFNTVVNPLLYGVFSENFRACLTRLWKRGGEASCGQKAGTTGQNGTTSAELRQSGAANCTSNATSTPKSLKQLQDRLKGWPGQRAVSGGVNNANTRQQLPKLASSSIGSIIEVPASEKA